MRVGELQEVKTDGDDISISLGFDYSPETLDKMEKLKGKRVTFDIKAFKEKRSLSANSYMWHLLGEMSRVLHTDIDSLYKLELTRWGVWQDLIVPCDAIERLKKEFRYVERFSYSPTEKDADMTEIRVYFGTSTYDTSEMSRLINGIVADAKEINVETLTPNEIKDLIQLMEANNV